MGSLTVSFFFFVYSLGIYRHVRLKKGFCNVESNEHGKLKLKIPQVIFPFPAFL